MDNAAKASELVHDADGNIDVPPKMDELSFDGPYTEDGAKNGDFAKESITEPEEPPKTAISKGPKTPEGPAPGDIVRKGPKTPEGPAPELVATGPKTPPAIAEEHDEIIEVVETDKVSDKVSDHVESQDSTAEDAGEINDKATKAAEEQAVKVDDEQAAADEEAADEEAPPAKKSKAAEDEPADEHEETDA